MRSGSTVTSSTDRWCTSSHRKGHADFVSLDIGSSHLGIGRDPTIASGDNSRQRFSLWVYADDCDAAIERLRSGGVTIVEEPVDQPWGERVARVLDPDGNSIVIGAAAVDAQSEE